MRNFKKMRKNKRNHENCLIREIKYMNKVAAPVELDCKLLKMSETFFLPQGYGHRRC